MDVKSILIVALTCLLAALMYFEVEFFYESKSVIPASTTILVKSESYEIDGRKNADLLLLLDGKFGKKEQSELPAIIVKTDEGIEYARLIETLNILKNNGYGEVALSSEE